MIRDRRLAAYKAFSDLSWPDSSTDEFWRSTPFKRIETGLAVVDGSEAVYICENYACRAPITQPDELRQALATR